MSSKNLKLDTLFFLCSLTGGFIFVAAALLISRQALVENFSLSLHVAIAAVCVLLYSVWVKCLFIYQIWSLIQDGGARAAPVKAVGLLFIPLFNLYWVFQALWGFSRDYNRYLERNALNTPRLPEPLFLAYCIVSALTPAAAVIPAAGLLYAAAAWILFILIVLKTGPAANALAVAVYPPEKISGKSGRAVLPVVRRGRVRLCGFIFASLIMLVVLIIILLPRPKFSVERFTVAEEAVSGDTFVATAALRNCGRAEGQYNLAVFVDGEKVEESTVILEAGAGKEVKFLIPGNYEPGDFTISLGVGVMMSMLDGFAKTIRILKPAEFIVSNLSLDPPQVNIGEETIVRVKVSNVGEAEGSQGVLFTIDGALRETKYLTLKGESSEEVSFSLTLEEPGCYTLAVNGLSENFDVFKIERPDNGTVLVNEIAGGHGRLIVKNNRTTDALVLITSPEDYHTTLLAVYVRAKSTAHVGGIEDGTYIIFFSEGNDWDSYSKRFTKNVSHNRFDSEDRFVTDHHSTGYTYTILNIEFGITGSVDGSAKVNPVDPGNFPAIRTD